MYHFFPFFMGMKIGIQVSTFRPFNQRTMGTEGLKIRINLSLGSKDLLKLYFELLKAHLCLVHNISIGLQLKYLRILLYTSGETYDME